MQRKIRRKEKEVYNTDSKPISPIFDLFATSRFNSRGAENLIIVVYREDNLMWTTAMLSPLGAMKNQDSKYVPPLVKYNRIVLNLDSEREQKTR